MRNKKAKEIRRLMSKGLDRSFFNISTDNINPRRQHKKAITGQFSIVLKSRGVYDRPKP